MKILIATSFAIPHAGGASTHIELLASHLQARGTLHGLLDAKSARQGLFARLAYLPLRLLNRDRARALRLEWATRAMTKAISRSAKGAI